MTKKMNIAVLFGGRSGEHEVSLMSARSVLSVLNLEKFDVTQIGITHNGAWLTGKNVIEAFETKALNHLLEVREDIERAICWSYLHPIHVAQYAVNVVVALFEGLDHHPHK